MKRILILALATLGIPLSAQPAAVEDEEGLPPQAAIVRGVLVPVPRAIFQTLDRFADSNWRLVQRPELAHWRPPGAQAQNALLLGAVIAEGFVAVEAKDSEETKEIGRAVLKLARSLGVEKAALRRSRSIIEHAESSDWPGLRREWNGVLPDVQQGMNELRSEDVAQLVSLGGWLRGTQALAALISQTRSARAAELLRQPALLNYFEKQLAEMNRGLKSDPVVARMDEGLRHVRQALGPGDAPISPNQVKEIARVSGELLDSLNR
ncbi:MAG TPA: hypothetical protein VK474_04130 [Chthoniobacterales bacterium]|nr:hypothetical protein [Chthoniobacterales bacterium]